MRRFVAASGGCTTKWIVRVISCAVIALQPIPLVGALLLPLLCWSTYATYRRSLADRARVDLDASRVTA